MSDDKTDKFDGHLDECQQCREHPFALCEVGERLLKEAAVAPSFGVAENPHLSEATKREMETTLSAKEDAPIEVPPLKVNEIFYSLQGEGARAGEASIFIRLAGCDLACGFCDTEFVSGELMSLGAILAQIRDYPSRWIIFTGGEPMLQLKAGQVVFFQRMGFKVAIESNGNHPIPRVLDWIVVSPKVAEHVLAKNFPNGVDELRYVRHAGQPGVPEPQIKALSHFLSPVFKGDQPDPVNMRHCIDLCLKHPTWKLSLQLHKLWKIL